MGHVEHQNRAERPTQAPREKEPASNTRAHPEAENSRLVDRAQIPPVVSLTASDEAGYLGDRRVGDTDVTGNDEAGYLGDRREVDPVEQAKARLLQTQAGIDPDDQDSVDGATLAGAASYREQLESLPPDRRTEFVATTQDQVRDLFTNAADLSPQDLQTLVADLSQAGELAGPEAIEQMAQAVSDSLEGSFEDNYGMIFSPVTQAFHQAMIGGNGGLLQAAVTRNLVERGSHRATHMVQAQQLAMGLVAAEQAVGTQRAAELEGLFGNWVANNYQAYGPEATAAAEQAFRAEHADEYAEIQAHNENLASLLQAAAYTEQHVDVLSERSPFQQPDYVEAQRDILAQSVTLNTSYQADDQGVWRQSTLGDQVVADALLRSGDGEASWLDQAHVVAGQDGRDGLSDQLRVAEEQAVFSMSQVLTLDGRFDEVGTLVEGLAVHNPAFAGVAGDISSNLASIQRQAASGMISWEDASVRLGEAFSDALAQHPDIDSAVYERVVAMGIGVQGAMRYADSLGREHGGLEQFIDGGSSVLGVTAGAEAEYRGPGRSRLGSVANGLGLATGVYDFIQGDRDFQTVVGTAWSGAQFADDMVMALTRSGGSALVKSLGLPVGLALAGIDVITKIANGASAEEIAVASLPLVGAGIGASIGAIAGGIGAVPGAAIGLVVGGALQLISSLLGFGRGDATKEYEDESSVLTQAAMEHILGPGASPEVLEMMTEQFSMVDEDFVGTGPVMALIADEMGLSPHELFRQIAEIAGGEDGERQLKALIDDNLLAASITNWSDITDARDKLKNGEEAEIPSLEFADTDIAALAEMIDQAVESGSFYEMASVVHPLSGEEIEFQQLPELYETYEQHRRDGETDPFTGISADELTTWN